MGRKSRTTVNSVGCISPHTVWVRSFRIGEFVEMSLGMREIAANIPKNHARNEEKGVRKHDRSIDLNLKTFG
jgi:hypothetical protein